jgi:hypothetical protein
MTIFHHLAQWTERGIISPEQHSRLAALARGEPLSLYLELNLLLYAGVLAFVGGLGWTVTTWSAQMGDVLILTVLSALIGACLWYCFSRAPAWSPLAVPSPSLIFDYVLYLASLLWSVELGYIETRFQLFSGQYDFYLLASAALFFFLAYRFDNRLVLSLALSSLAAWFGLSLSHWSPWSGRTEEAYRQSAILYSLLIAASGAVARRRAIKPHFFGTYLNIAANVLFWALLSGVFNRTGYWPWFLALLAACAASLAWGLRRREFSFVAYAAVYGYIGVSSVLIRDFNNLSLVLTYFLVTGVAMLVALVRIALRYGRNS